MRIAQIAPLWEQVPPPAYGGTELVVSLLTEELVRRGHEVTLFAAGDSQTSANLEPCSPQSLRSLGLSYQAPEVQVYGTLQVKKVFERASEFDLIHSHVDLAAFPYVNFVKTPIVHTTHGIIPNYLEPLWRDACKQNFVSISDSQRRNDLQLNYAGTVYNGINTQIFPFFERPDETPYLAFLGRMSPQKGPHLAIEIARRTGWRLKMAGKVDSVDCDFFERKVKPFIDGKQIEFLGEANHVQKCQLLGGAVATLFPITWSEPFGLVMAESMAVGTPVIAIALGSTQEIIEDGKTGFLCRDLAECMAVLERIRQIDRRACRDHIVANFSVTKMVDGYEAVYQKLLERQFTCNGHVSHKNLNLKALQI
jgi:glycosyltransferase involved in cell wall biosynthesis